MGRDHRHLQSVDRLELIGLGVGRPSHTRELFIEAEVVLKGDGGEGLILVLDMDPLLGLYRLM